MLRRLPVLAFLVVVSLATVACGPDPAPFAYPDGRLPPAVAAQAPGPAPVPPALAGASSPGCGRATGKTGASVLHVTAAGHDRTYTLVAPEGRAAGSPAPLVFVLHGSSGTGSRVRGQLEIEKQASGQAIFVYPDAPGGWDLDAPAATNRDVALFDAISLVVTNELCVDTRRVFVTGFSNGAYMANQLGCRRGDRIRGIVSHAGGGPYELAGSYDAQGHLTCPGKPVAALVVHGTSDTTVPEAEGQKSIDHWSQANRCSAGSSATLAAPCTALAGCYQPVDVCRIPGLGHAVWKGAARVTWQFIDSLR
ncbi:MAG: phospholipase/Carboxylesterase [Labilithrix sp.]|nr:phospholipase/Carboxylesterase [Labilithrix sp.]